MTSIHPSGDIVQIANNPYYPGPDDIKSISKLLDAAVPNTIDPSAFVSTTRNRK